MVRVPHWRLASGEWWSRQWTTSDWIRSCILLQEVPGRTCCWRERPSGTLLQLPKRRTFFRLLLASAINSLFIYFHYRRDKAFIKDSITSIIDYRRENSLHQAWTYYSARNSETFCGNYYRKLRYTYNTHLYQIDITHIDITKTRIIIINITVLSIIIISIMSRTGPENKHDAKRFQNILKIF
jgi:hypothetical protein